MKLLPIFSAIILVLSADAAFARRCELNGAQVNLDHGATYAGKSGRVKCYDEEGVLVSERTLRNGEFIGFERSLDLWGNVHERTVNQNGNSQGVAREFWPDGTLKSEANYEDGRVVGLSRRFHRNGRLERVAFYETGSKQEAASIEFEIDGRLKMLRCADRSLIPQDREVCGFAGERTTELYRHGRLRERVTYAQGQLLRTEQLGDAGAVVTSQATGARSGVRRAYHPNGKMASELVVTDGYRVAEREWYMNGQLRRELTREARERDWRSTMQLWRDDGSLAEREERIGPRLVSRTRYDTSGRLKQIEDYAAAGQLDRRRQFAPDGKIESDERFYPDGSRK